MRDFVIGAIFGIAFILLILMLTPSNCKKGYDALKKCEQSLPRNEHCIIIAVPIGEEND